MGGNRQDKSAFMAQSHKDFRVSPRGLVVWPSKSNLGSWPDGIARPAVAKGAVEIKYRGSLQGNTEYKQFCLD